jgi:hypothetical protein
MLSSRPHPDMRR